MKKRRPSTCMFCGVTETLTSEHILPHWMRDDLPDTEVPHRGGILWRKDQATGQMLPQHYQSRRGSGEHRSQTLRVVCGNCNNGWMSQIVEDGRPAIEPLMLGRWENLSDETQRKIATWFVLHNMVYERFWDHLQITPFPERQQFMADHDPGFSRSIWIARTVDDSLINVFARVIGSADEPSSSSRTKLVIAATVGKFSLLSIYDPTHSIDEAKMQKIQELLAPWSLRIWPQTVNAQPPQAMLVAGSLDEFVKDIHLIIDGGESRIARVLPEIENLGMEMLERLRAEGKWPPIGS